MSDERRAIVIGAGIVGVCCALALVRAGSRVTLIDPRPPGEQASFGHAGVIGVPYCLPAASPAALRHLPRMILDTDHPFVLRARATPGLIPWFAAFARASRPERVQRNTAAAVALQRDVRADWDDVLTATRTTNLVKWAGMLEVCETNTSLAASRAGWHSMREQGFRVVELGAQEIRELEPALAPAVVGGALLSDAGHTVDPFALTKALHGHFLELGGTFVRDRVRSIAPVDEAVCTAVGDLGAHSAPCVVVATGVHAPELVDPFGNTTPIAAERGYHVMFADPRVELRRPVTAVDRKVVISSLATGLRMTSMAEFTAPDAPPDHARAERVFRKAFPLLPGLRTAISSRWVGSRPSTPDSLPVIRRSPRHRAVIFAFGHGSKGFTNAATTGRLVCEMAQVREACA